MWLLLLACGADPTPPPVDELQAVRDGCDIGIVSECLTLGAELWETDRRGSLEAYGKACTLGHEVSCEVVAEEG